jgi:hypothetical protein
MAELHETLMGRKLIEHTFPEIARQLARVADAMEKPTLSKNTIEVGVYYYINDAGKKIYDLEKMFKEFKFKISELENK